jgi:hypothetical protein
VNTPNGLRTGASRVHIFSHVVRQAHTHFLYLNDDTTEEPSEGTSETKLQETSRPAPENSDSEAADENKPKLVDHIPSSLQGPIRGVHIDQSYGFAPVLLKAQFPSSPEEAERLLKGRFQILNIWRPLKTVFKDPFAVCDARSVDDDELVPVKIKYPAFDIESWSVRGEGSDAHKWWYMSQQTPDEVLVFKCFDSVVDGRARRVPHSSFTDTDFEDGDARQSIELRAFVFHEADGE